MTFGHGKTRTNVGIPGTGLSYSATEKNEGSGFLTIIIVVLAIYLALSLFGAI